MSGPQDAAQTNFAAPRKFNPPTVLPGRSDALVLLALMANVPRAPLFPAAPLSAALAVAWHRQITKAGNPSVKRQSQCPMLAQSGDGDYIAARIY